MSRQIKSLLRGLRYISAIFEEKEPDLQIGHPTDVKHVAHIGWDGPSADKPSWMNEFSSSPVYGNGSLSSFEDVNLSTQSAFEDDAILRSCRPEQKARRSSSAAASPVNSPARKSADVARRSTDSARRSTDSSRRSTDGRKQSTCHGGGDSPLFSSRSPSSLLKLSRRDRSANALIDSPTREPSTNSTRSSRKQHHSNAGTGSPARDGLYIPKHSHARKTKISSKKSKAPNSSPDALKDCEPLESELGQGVKTTAGHLT